MAISVGDRLPDATFMTLTEDGPKEIKGADLFTGKRVILFAVPGAFTPTCHKNHLPGYLEKMDDLKAKGIDAVACVAVNDMFVMDAWAKSTGADGKIVFLSDGSADFTKAIGMELDASGFGMGLRSKRYSMLVEDGVVKAINVEENPTEADVSGAPAMVEAL